MSVLPGVDEVLLGLGDLEVPHVDSLGGAVGSIQGGDVEFENLLPGKTSELDALSPEEVGFLGRLSLSPTPGPYLAIKPAMALVVSGEATDAALHFGKGVQHAVDGGDDITLLLLPARKMFLCLEGLPLLPVDDLLYGEDQAPGVSSFRSEALILFVGDTFATQVFLEGLTVVNSAEEGGEVEFVELVGALLTIDVDLVGHGGVKFGGWSLRGLI